MSTGLSFNLYDDNWLFKYSEFFFKFFFLVEMILKIVAFGLKVGKESYFSQKWNYLEFVVVIFCVIGLLPGFKHFTVISNFRLFRPLKTSSFLKNIKNLFEMLLQSLKNVFYLIIFLSFFVFFFALIGVTLWSDIYSNLMSTY